MFEAESFPTPSAGLPAQRVSLFLTGGTGFFGRSLLRYLQRLENHGQNPFRVSVMSRAVEAFLAKFPEFSSSQWLSFHEGNILEGLSAFPIGMRFDAALHAASDSVSCDSTPQGERVIQIINGTRTTLEFAALAGIKRFLYVSSGAVYGEQPEDCALLNESFEGSPNPLLAESDYGLAKRCAENLSISFANKYGFDCCIARCFSFIGPDLPLDAHFAAGNLIRDAIHGRELVVLGDGSVIRSYLYQEDLAHWLLTTLTKGKSGNAYNIGSDQEITIRELAECIRNSIAPGKQISYGRGNTSAEHRKRYVPSIIKAKSDMGLSVSVSIVDAIKLTAQGILEF